MRVERAAAVLRRDQKPHHPLDGGAVALLGKLRSRHLVAQDQRLEAGARRALAVGGGVVLLQTLQRAAQDTHDPVGSLAVAAEPEEIVRHAALDHALRALYTRGINGRLPQAAVRRQLAIRDDPDVAGARFRRAQGHRKVGGHRHGEAARHHRVAVGGGGDKQADGERLRPQALGRERRRRAEAHVLLGHKLGAAQLDLLGERAPLLVRQRGADAAVLRAARAARALLRRTDHHAIEVGQHVPALLGLAEPKARGVRDEQLLAQEMLGDRRQIAA